MGVILTTENIFQNFIGVFRREQTHVAPKSDFLFGAQYIELYKTYFAQRLRH